MLPCPQLPRNAPGPANRRVAGSLVLGGSWRLLPWPGGRRPSDPRGADVRNPRTGRCVLRLDRWHSPMRDAGRRRPRCGTCAQVLAGTNIGTKPQADRRAGCTSVPHPTLRTPPRTDSHSRTHARTRLDAHSGTGTVYGVRGLSLAKAPPQTSIVGVAGAPQAGKLAVAASAGAHSGSSNWDSPVLLL